MNGSLYRLHTEAALFTEKLHDACVNIARVVSDSWASCSTQLRNENETKYEQ